MAVIYLFFSFLEIHACHLAMVRVIHGNHVNHLSAHRAHDRMNERPNVYAANNPYDADSADLSGDIVLDLLEQGVPFEESSPPDALIPAPCAPTANSCLRIGNHDLKER